MNNKNGIFYYCFITIILWLSCTPESSYKTLSFVFDGVPEPTYSSSNSIIDSSIIINTADNKKNVEVSSKPKMVYHVPYLEKQCYDCHDRNKMGKLVKFEPELCYLCHDDFYLKHKYIHGPVAGGACSSCHNSHQSKFDNLLLYNDKQLCNQCHDSTRISRTKFHINNLETNCVECHNAHGGEDRFLSQRGSCYNCHEDFKEKYSYLHGPVGAQLCNTCHKSHSDSKEVLLLHKGRVLCFKCHDIELVFKNEVHEDIEGTDCIECHNPHGGEDRSILN